MKNDDTTTVLGFSSYGHQALAITTGTRMNQYISAPQTKLFFRCSEKNNMHYLNESFGLEQKCKNYNALLQCYQNNFPIKHKATVAELLSVSKAGALVRSHSN